MARRPLFFSGLVILILMVLLIPISLHRSAAGSDFFSDPSLASMRLALEAASKNPFTRPFLERALAELQANGLMDLLLARFSKDGSQPQALSAGGVIHRLTFPHVVSGSGSGLLVRTNAIILNSSDTNANGTVYLKGVDGNPLSVSTNQGTASSFDFHLLPGETWRLSTDGSGPLVIGWIEVLSDIPLAGSATYALFTAGGEFLSEVGIGDSPRSKSLMIYVDTRQGKNTAYAVCNPSATGPVNLTLQLRRMNGTPAAPDKTLQLQALRQRAEFVTESFPSVDFSAFQGVLVISNPDTEVAVTTLRARGVKYTSLPSAPEVASGASATPLYFARLGDGVFGGLKMQSSMFLLNHSANKATAVVDLYKADGTSAELVIGGVKNKRFTVEVPAGGAVDLTTDAVTNPGITGWAQVTTDYPLSGSGAFTITEASGAFLAEVGVPNSTRTRKAIVFGQVSPSVDIGVGITNLVSYSQDFTLRLISAESGAAAVKAGASAPAAARVLSEKTISLNQYSHDARFVSEYFSDVPEVKQRNFEGWVEVASQWDYFAGLTLLSHGAYLTSLPVAEQKTTKFAPKLQINSATLLEGSKPCLCANISQASGEMPIDKATLTLDKVSVDYSKFTDDGQIIGWLTYKAVGYWVAGRLFVSNPTADSANFFTAITPDGTKESCPFVGTLRNLPGGGVEVTIASNPGIADPYVAANTGYLCFDPGIFQMPSGSAQTVSVAEQYDSFDQTPGQGDKLYRTASSSFSTSTLAGGTPRVDSVTPSRLVPGQEVTIAGANFSTTLAANTVSLPIPGSARANATVLEANAKSLKVRTPDQAIPGALQVSVGGATSNSYNLQLPFTAFPALTFGSTKGGADTTLTFSTTQRVSTDLQLLEGRVDFTKGSWKTSGWAVGTVVGAIGVSPLSYTGTPYRTDYYDLKVKSSDASKLVVDAIERGTTDDPLYTVEFANGSPGPSMVIAVYSYSLTQEIGFATRISLELSQALFKMPAGAGVAFDANIKLLSMPERTQVKGTAFEIDRTSSFTTTN